jgi:glucose-6-phosphate isomerase, archaeal
MEHHHLPPGRILLDLAEGRIERGEVSLRRLGDLPGVFQEPVAPGSTEVVYSITSGGGTGDGGDDLLCCTTRIEPGTVGDEYHMTRGHFHAVRERSEVYLGLGGSGLVLLARSSAEWTTERLEPGSLITIPGGWAHRTINTGAEPLVFLSVWIADAGHDYATIDRCGFPVLVLRGPDGPRTVPNPRHLPYPA